MDNAATTLVGTEKRKTNGMWELHGSGGVTICIIGARADSIGRPTNEFTSLGLFALALLPLLLVSQHLYARTKILKAVKVSQKKQTPYNLPFVWRQAVLIGFPETQQQFWPKVQRSNPSPLTLWLASTFVTCCTRFALHHSHKISYSSWEAYSGKRSNPWFQADQTWHQLQNNLSPRSRVHQGLDYQNWSANNCVNVFLCARPSVNTF